MGRIVEPDAEAVVRHLMCVHACLRCWLQSLASDDGYAFPGDDVATWQGVLCSIGPVLGAAREEFEALVPATDEASRELFYTANMLECAELALWNLMQGRVRVQLRGDELAHVGWQAVIGISRVLEHPLLRVVPGNHVGGYAPEREAA